MGKSEHRIDSQSGWRKKEEEHAGAIRPIRKPKRRNHISSTEMELL
jgi:hypothetical protein